MPPPVLCLILFSYIGSSTQIFAQAIFLKYCTDLPVTYPFYFSLIRNIQPQKKPYQCSFSTSGSSSYTSGFPFWKNATQISNTKLITIITIVHAKRSGIFRYIFALYSFSPIEPEDTPITSAATPALDFYHRTFFIFAE